MTRFSHSIVWMNPYKDPPLELPRKLLEIINDIRNYREDPGTLTIIDNLINFLYSKKIYGYGVGFEIIDKEDKPTRKWSMEAKHRNRKKRLAKRIAKKYSIPELYEKAFAEAIAKKPEYYGEEKIDGT